MCQLQAVQKSEEAQRHFTNLIVSVTICSNSGITLIAQMLPIRDAVKFGPTSLSNCIIFEHLLHTPLLITGDSLIIQRLGFSVFKPNF